MKRIKVAPSESDFQMDDIDADINRILADVDSEIRKVYDDNSGSNYFNDTSSNIAATKQKPFRAPVNPSASVPTSNRRDSQGADNHPGVPANRKDSAASRTNFRDEIQANPYDDDDGEEEVKLLHETDQGGRQVLEEFKNQFQVLTSQVGEFKSRLKKITAKLKETTTSKLETEDKLNDLADEYKALMEGIGESEAASGGQPLLGRHLVMQQSRAGFQDDNDFARGEALRKALLAFDDVDSMANFNDMSYKSQLYLRFRSFLVRFVPFRSDIRQMQSRFGASAASYFVFYRFLFIQYSFISILVLGFGFKHSSSMANRGNGTKILSSNGGLLPGIMYFSSYTEEEALLYSLTIILVIVVAAVCIVEKFLREDKLSKELTALEAENQTPFASEVLCAWEFSLENKEEVSSYSVTIRDALAVLCEDNMTKKVVKQRSVLERALLISRQVIGFFAYIAVQTASFATILYWTANGNQVTDPLTGIPILQSLKPIILALLLNLINAMTPMLIKKITKFEKWDSAEIETYYKSTRMFLSNFLNSYLLVLSYILSTDPIILSYSGYRDSFAAQHATGNCVFNETADGLFTVLISTFPLDFFMMFVGAFAKLFISLVLRRDKVYRKSEFDIADCTVRVLNFINLGWLNLPFNPLALLIMPAYVYLNLKIEKLILWEWFNKPKRPWKAQRANSFFTLFYMISFFSSCIPISIYFLVGRTFPKNCAIQDNSIDLCIGPGNSQYACELDPNSIYYDSFKDKGYPGVICNETCGAFVNYDNAWHPVYNFIEGDYFMASIWNIFLASPYLPWALAVALMIISALRYNTIVVTMFSKGNSDRINSARIETYKVSINKLNKKVANMQMLHSMAAASADADDNTSMKMDLTSMGSSNDLASNLIAPAVVVSPRLTMLRASKKEN